MKKSLSFSLLAAAALISSQAFAAAPKWEYVDLNYIKLDVDNTNVEPDGGELQWVQQFGNNFFVQGSYLKTSDDLGNDELDLDVIELGVGYKHSLTHNTDWYSSISYMRYDQETDNTDLEENGVALATGLRSMLTENFELAGEISYTYLNRDDNVDSAGRFGIYDDRQTSASIQSTYYLTENFGINAGYRYASDIKGFNVGVRYAF